MWKIIVLYKKRYFQKFEYYFVDFFTKAGHKEYLFFSQKISQQSKNITFFKYL